MPQKKLFINFPHWLAVLLLFFYFSTMIFGIFVTIKNSHHHRLTRLNNFLWLFSFCGFASRISHKNPIFWRFWRIILCKFWWLHHRQRHNNAIDTLSDLHKSILTCHSWKIILFWKTIKFSSRPSKKMCSIEFSKCVCVCEERLR